MSRNVADEVFLLTRRAAKDLPEAVGLDVVLACNRELLGHDSTSPLLVLLIRLDGLVGERARGGRVVGVCAVVAVDVHVAVAMERREALQRAVDGDLLVVATQTVAVGVWVGEETGLENRVGGGLGAGDHVRGRESRLFDLGEIVLRVLVQGEAAEAAERHLGLRPHLCQVEDVPAELLRLLGAQNLHVAGPRGVLATLDGVEEVLCVPVGVLGGELPGLVVGEGLVALVGLAVDLHVVEGAVGLDPLVRVAGVGVHVAVRVWGAPVTEQVHHLVDGLVVGGQVVPEHGSILEVGLRVALLGVNEHGELGRVTQEENGGVVEHPVPVALLRIELDGESARVARAVGRSLLTTDGGEAGEHLGLLANVLEHVDGGLRRE